MKSSLQNGPQPFITLGDRSFEHALMDIEWQISYMIRHMTSVLPESIISIGKYLTTTRIPPVLTTIFVCLCSTVGERNKADVVQEGKAHD